MFKKDNIYTFPQLCLKVPDALFKINYVVNLIFESHNGKLT